MEKGRPNVKQEEGVQEALGALEKVRKERGQILRRLPASLSLDGRPCGLPVNCTIVYLFILF